jgi:hypothetical protein
MGIRRIRQCKACKRKFTPKYQASVEEAGPDPAWTSQEANATGP